jgi:hypothetical protein
VHDLEPMRHPVHAGEQRGLVHVRGRRGGEAKDDFRLDARLGKSAERQ